MILCLDSYVQPQTLSGPCQATDHTVSYHSFSSQNKQFESLKSPRGWAHVSRLLFRELAVDRTWALYIYIYIYAHTYIHIYIYT